MKRSREPEDEDDAAGYSEDAAIIPVSKIINLDTEDSGTKKAVIQCSLPGHARGTSFTSYAEYDRHYSQVHSNRCHKCRKNFPTSHILSLHIQEHHDALAEVKREKGESTYACFVEVCKDKFQSYGAREEHLIRGHIYPQDYFFAVTKFGINDRRQSMLVEHRKEIKQSNSQRKESCPGGRKPRSHAAKPAARPDNTGESKDVQMTDAERPVNGEQEPAQDVPIVETSRVAMSDVENLAPVAKPSEKQEQQRPMVVDAEMEDLVGAMSSLKFVPRAVRLGPKQKPRR